MLWPLNTSFILSLHLPPLSCGLLHTLLLLLMFCPLASLVSRVDHLVSSEQEHYIHSPYRNILSTSPSFGIRQLQQFLPNEIKTQ